MIRALIRLLAFAAAAGAFALALVDLAHSLLRGRLVVTGVAELTRLLGPGAASAPAPRWGGAALELLGAAPAVLVLAAAAALALRLARPPSRRIGVDVHG